MTLTDLLPDVRIKLLTFYLTTPLQVFSTRMRVLVLSLIIVLISTRYRSLETSKKTAEIVRITRIL